MEKEIKDFKLSVKVTQRHNDYLEKVAKEKGITKSAYVLELVNKDMLFK